MRTTKALELYHEGYAKRMMLTALSPGGSTVQRSAPDPRVRQAIEAGVPAENLVLDDTARNTWEEITAIRQAMISGGWKRVIVVSDPPHMRRIQLACERLLSPQGIEYTLVPTTPSWWDSSRWWSNDAAAEFVFDEYAKLVYYFFRYPSVMPPTAE